MRQVALAVKKWPTKLTFELVGSHARAQAATRCIFPPRERSSILVPPRGNNEPDAFP
jgi:hypothetical protein